MRRATDLLTVLNAKATTGSGSAQLVQDFEFIGITLNAEGTASLTVKFQGSMADSQPDWDAAQSSSNQWDYINVKDLEDNSAIDGDTGFVLVANDHRNLEANVNGLKWINAVVTSRTTGNVTVKVKGFTSH